MIGILRILRESIRAVPAVKYALGVSGVIAAIALIKAFNLGWSVAALGAVVMFGLMTLLLLFARLTAYGPSFFYTPARVFTWAFVIITVTCAVLLASSVFFNEPIHLRDVVVPKNALAQAGSIADDPSYRGPGTIFAIGTMRVDLQDRGKDVLITIDIDPYMFPSIEVDFNQNDALDPGLDRSYGVMENGQKCTQFLLDLGGATACGGFKSDSSVSVQMVQSGTKLVKRISWLIPKRELSEKRTTAHLLLHVADRREGLHWWYFPSDTFANPLKVRYQR